MSKNYTNYSKFNNSNKPTDAVENAPAIAAVETPEPEVPVIDPVATPEPENTTVPEVPETVIGWVCNCKKLNVRKDANKTADVIRVIEVGDEVEIISEGETADFYCVRFDDVIGFCMKEYIGIDQ
jgi:hypothetical protein